MRVKGVLGSTRVVCVFCVEDGALGREELGEKSHGQRIK
jgi:hypothetical protein